MTVAWLRFSDQVVMTADSLCDFYWFILLVALIWTSACVTVSPHPKSHFWHLSSLIWTLDVRIYVLALHLFEDISTFLKDFGYLLNFFKVTCYFGTTSIWQENAKFLLFFFFLFLQKDLVSLVNGLKWIQTYNLKMVGIIRRTLFGTTPHFPV